MILSRQLDNILIMDFYLNDIFIHSIVHIIIIFKTILLDTQDIVK